MEKMNQLDRENKELYNRVSKLKYELQGYYDKSLNNYDEKFNSIKWGDLREPTGESCKKALREQQ
jgi:hypothetical protein